MLWFTSVPSIHVREISDLGLVSQVQPTMLLGTALIGLGFVLTLRLHPVPSSLALVATVLVILTIHGLPTYVEDAPRFAVAYLHAGFTDVIARKGTLLPLVDARFSWPLFFTLGAFVTQSAGIANAIALQPWSPIVFNLLYLIPLLTIYRTFTADRRLIWAGLFIFFATTWIGQDYYSPQALNFLFYLTVLAIVLRWFGTRNLPDWVRRGIDWTDRRWPWLRAPMREVGEAPPPRDAAAANQAQGVALVGIIVLLVAASVASHQLTPFALLASVTVLTIVRRNRIRGLPVLIAVMTAIWISYMTVAFLAGNLPGLIEELLSAGEAADVNVGQRIAGSPGHVFVVQARLVFTLVLWLLAAAGALRRYRWGSLDLEAIALAATPFGLILLQAYGGEMLLRVYLFSLPFVAFLVAGLFLPSPARALSPSATRVMGAAMAILLLVLIVTKHGNERADLVTADELALLDRAYALAPAGSVLAGVTSGSPMRYRDFGDYEYVFVGADSLPKDPRAVREQLGADGRCAYLFVSRSQRAGMELYSGITPAAWESFVRSLTESGEFERLLANADASLYLAEPAPADCGGPG